MLGRKRVNEALALMGEMFPNAHGELEWETPFQLLVAVILSAQTTDKAVNKITPGLWARYPEIEDLASANLMMLRCVCEQSVFIRIRQRTSSRLLELF